VKEYEKKVQNSDLITVLVTYDEYNYRLVSRHW